jgi:DNA-binding beta-propeller fold protein YncE
LGSLPQDFAFDGTHVWVTNSNHNNVVRMKRDGRGRRGYPTGNFPVGIVYDGTSIWVANYDDNTVTKITLHEAASQGSP